MWQENILPDVGEGCVTNYIETVSFGELVDVMGRALVIYSTLDQNSSRRNIKYMSFFRPCTM
jgi:hypothetical protein